MSEAQTIHILKQMRKGFAELRSRKVIHRDLKLANIFMHNDRVIIGMRFLFGIYWDFIWRVWVGNFDGFQNTKSFFIEIHSLIFYLKPQQEIRSL